MRNNSILTAVLGVLIGAMAVSFFFQVRERKALYNTQYRDWRKLNLILEQIDANYVDTVDKKALTDAAVEAALSKLDPHSTYCLLYTSDAADE